ncbi:MAG: RnfABCDGE type electron transport complex subunit D [Bacilli bacterium]|nr:RnfABCDGE type electron transport complex subunit D [Bacilli bacterium]
MKEFKTENGPHIKSNFNTTKMMRHLLIALLPLIIFSIYKNGYLPYSKGYGTLYDVFKPLLLIITGVLTSLISEALFAKFIMDKKDINLKDYLKYSYAIFPGLFLALIVPINTPLSVMIIGSLFATIVGKMLFGGFGYNVFNPALIGNLFISSTYLSVITDLGGYLNKMEVDVTSGATPLSNLQSLNYISTYDKVVSTFGSLGDFFLGFIPGSVAETSALLCLIGLIYLIITKVVKWRIPVIYILTVFVLTSFIGLYNGLGIWYPLFHILSGGLMFGAIFMATDPVTSPTTPYGQVIYALLLGLLTVIFRFLTSYPEGVLTAILTLNMLIFIIDKIGMKARFDNKKIYISLIVILIVMSFTTFYISVNAGSKEKKDDTFKVINVETIDKDTIYTVSHKGSHGPIELVLTFDPTTNQIKEIEVLKQSEDVWTQIENNDYLNRLITNQNNIADLDTISGATITSNYLKQLVIKTINHYNENR